jgi:hypothetical protein
MLDKIFGILHLSSRTIIKDDKGHIYKKFTPFDSHIKPFNVRTKKNQLIDIYCIVSIDTLTVLEYYNNLKTKDIPKILALANWKNLNKLNINEIIQTDLTPNRIDLTNLTAYTIDPSGSLDRDDAIGVDIKNSKIFIHIADPSSYINTNTELDRELRIRGESVYLDKTHHMFPEVLATKHISLTENQINRAFTLELQLSKDMKNIISHQFYKSLIKVKNLTYDEFENNMNNDTVYSDSNYLILYNFGKSLRYNIKYDSHIMVENYMIICNTYVAEELKNISSIIRYNKNAIINNDIIDTVNPKLIDMYKICSYDAATYELNTDYSGHAALNLEHYTHFTSPLRRYADLMLHRLLYLKIFTHNSNYYTSNYIKILCSDLNMIKNLYKIAYNLNNFHNIMGDLTQLELEVNIIYFDMHRLKLYSVKHNMIFNIVLIHKSIKKLTNTTTNSNELHIELFNNDDSFTELFKFKLFQQVKIKIYKFNSSTQPFKIDFIEPKLSLV